jgi:hypothetical protein
MKFWNILRWLGTAFFLGVWLLSCASAPTDSSTATQAPPHAAPEFQH